MSTTTAHRTPNPGDQDGMGLTAWIVCACLFVAVLIVCCVFSCVVKRGG